MSASYPSATKSFTTKTDGPGQTIFAAHVNDLQDEVVAIEAGLRDGLAHDMKPLTDASSDVGTSAKRWRDGFFSRNVKIEGVLTTTSFNYFGTTTALSSQRRATFVGASSLITDAGAKSGSVLISTSGSSAGEGGTLEFGFGYAAFTQSYFSAIKAIGVDGSNNSQGDLGVYIRKLTADTGLTISTRFYASTGVGIGGASDPGAGALGVVTGINNGGWAKESEIAVAQIVANTDNWNPTGLLTTHWLNVSSDASRNVTGLVAVTGGRIGLINVGAQAIVLKHGSGSSTAANRFQLPRAQDVTLDAGDTIELFYSTLVGAWIGIGYRDGGAGA